MSASIHALFRHILYESSLDAMAYRHMFGIPAWLWALTVSPPNFYLQVVEVPIIEVELALERPVRHTAALAQQCEDLVQQRVKVHHRRSPCLSGHTRTTKAASQGEDSLSFTGHVLALCRSHHPSLYR